MLLPHDMIRDRLCGVDAFVETQIFPAIEQGRIILHPLPSEAVLERRLGTSSIDLTLGRTITTVKAPLDGRPVNPDNPEDMARVRHDHYDITDSPFYLKPMQFVLGMTEELVGMPTDLVGMLRDRSRMARNGVTVCLNSPKVDPGFYGTIVLEINNRSQVPYELRRGMAITQLTFLSMASVPSVPYHRRTSSRWAGQTATTAPTEQTP